MDYSYIIRKIISIILLIIQKSLFEAKFKIGKKFIDLNEKLNTFERIVLNFKFNKPKTQ